MSDEKLEAMRKQEVDNNTERDRYYRLECLRLAAQADGRSISDTVVRSAAKWADFVLHDKRPEVVTDLDEAES